MSRTTTSLEILEYFESSKSYFIDIKYRQQKFFKKDLLLFKQFCFYKLGSEKIRFRGSIFKFAIN